MNNRKENETQVNSGCLVSVVTPAYNAEKTLPLCIESIQTQTWPHWEHIIVDDGSVDGTWDLLVKYADDDPRIRIFKQTNAGQGKARNLAIGMAKGEYIALLDADDKALPNRLELQISFFQKNPDVDVLGGSIINVTENGDEINQSRRPAEHERLSKNIFRQGPFFTSTVMARKIFFIKTGGFDESARCRRSQDFDLWLRGHKRFKYHNLHEALAYYTYNPNLQWRDGFYRSKVLINFFRQNRLPFYHYWYVFRPFASRLLRLLRIIKYPK